MSNPLYTPSEVPKVVKVFQRSRDIDGFSAELQNGEVIDISSTQWVIPDNKRSDSSKIVFQNFGREISFTQEQESLANNLLGLQ